MPIRRRTSFPGLATQAIKELLGLQDDLIKESAALREESIGSTTDTKSESYAARFNEVIRVLPPAAGMTLAFPAASPKTQNKWIEVLKLGGGTCTVVPTSGQVMGAPSFPLTLAGFYYFKSDAQSGWWIQPSSSGGLTSPVSFVDIQQIGANTWLGNITGALGPITANTLAQLKTYIGNFSAGVAGLVPNTSGGVATTFLNGAGGFTVPAGSPPTVGAQSVHGNATGAPAPGADIASAVQSALFRGAGSLGFGAAAADQALQRLGSGDLGFSATCRLLRAPQIITATTAAFAHPAGTRFIVVEGVGGGGASGGAAAVAGSAGNGGNSANWARRTFTSISGTSNVTIGAGGTAGAAGAAGNNGGNSVFTHNAVTLTIPGGIGGAVLAGGAVAALSAANAGNAATTGHDVQITGQLGQRAYRSGAAATVASGDGGSNPLGLGGMSLAVATVTTAGVPGTGFGSGASGRNNGPTAVAQAGTAGQPGAFIVWEFS